MFRFTSNFGSNHVICHLPSEGGGGAAPARLPPRSAFAAREKKRKETTSLGLCKISCRTGSILHGRWVGQSTGLEGSGQWGKWRKLKLRRRKLSSTSRFH
ncbi:hypothetical protein NL676_035478 [Syzygium grande]|nr:hypothetical protein NL676_035478 [Syzygium grande]